MLNLKADIQNPVQENFLGNGAVYHGYAGMPDKFGRVYNEQQCDIEADRAADMRLKIARTFYGWYAYDFEKQCYDWESERMRVFYRWCERLKKRGIDIAIQAGWNNPGDVLSSSWNGISPFTVEGDWEKSVQNYAEWVSESIHQLVEVRGFTNVKYLIMFTEPQNDAGGTNGHDSVGTYNTWKDCVKAVHERLLKDGRRHLVKIVGPNEGSTTTSAMLRWVGKNADEYVDVYSSHNYLFTDCLMPDEIRTGTRAVRMQVPGSRANQTVKIKPNTDYELSVYLRFHSENRLNVSGYAVFGAFKSEGEDPTIVSGGEPTNRLNATSVKMLDLSRIDDKFERYTHRFNSGDADTAEIGIFYDGKDKDSFLCVDDFELCEVGGSDNLVENPSFEDDKAWRYVAGCNVSSDAYYDWKTWVKTARGHIPNNKPFWFDEYNVQFDARYTDPRHGSRVCMASIALMNAGCQSSLLWTVFDQQWPDKDTTNADCFVDGDHRCGFMPVLTRSLTPYPGYYAWSLLSRYTGGGEGVKVYEGKGEDNVQLTVTKTPSGDITVVVVSNNYKSRDFSIDFGCDLNCSLNRHVFDPDTVKPDENAEIIASDKTFDVKNRLEDSIPAFGVTVYTTLKD